MHQLPNLPKVLLGMVAKSPSSNMDQEGRQCWVLLWSYAGVLTSLAVSILLYCPLLAKNVCMSTFLVQWLLGIQCCLWWLGSMWQSLGFKGKLILVGPEKTEHFLFVATKSSLVSQLSPSGCVPMGCGGKEPFLGQEKWIQPLVESQEQLFTRN